MKRVYSICGVALASELPLPELEPYAGKADWEARLATRLPAPRTAAWFQRWNLPDGRRWLDIARQGTAYRLRFSDCADFLVQPDARVIWCRRHTGVPWRTLRHLLLDQVLPLVAGGSTRLALHGSAVATPHGAIGFLADAGSGKSTLAASFAQSGCAVLSDDCLLVDTGPPVLALPAYPGVRLSRDSMHGLFPARTASVRVAHYSRKRRVGGRSLPFSRTASPLRRVYVIEGADDENARQDIRISRLSGRDALAELLTFVFHLDVGDAGRLRVSFDLAASLAALVPVRRLVYPRDYGRMDAVRCAILHDLAA